MWIIVIIVVIAIIIYFYNSVQDSHYSNNTLMEKRKVPTSNINKFNEEIEEDTSFSDYITTYEYKADLDSPHTSLEALNHHGEVRKNHKGIILPEFGDDQRFHGHWVAEIPELDKYSEPIKKDPLEPRTLLFLKTFRSVFESDLEFNVKYERISSILKEYSDLSAQKKASNWFLWELQEISGVSYSISEVLFYEGIKTKQDVKNASDEKLLRVAGIGPSRLKQIRASFLQEMTDSDKIKTYIDPTEIPSKKWFAENKIESKNINTTKAQIINLPKLKYEKTPDPADSISQNWDQYNSITLNALRYYNTKRYLLAKEEWLKILNWYHRDQRYYTNLLRSYRKLIEESIKKKKFNEAYEHLKELFKNCPDHTNTDIKTYNNVVFQLNKSNLNQTLEIKPLIAAEPNYFIDAPSVEMLIETSKPKEVKISPIFGTSILELKSLSDFLPNTLPHLYFDENKISFTNCLSIPSIPNNTYRFQESQNLSSFLSSSKELKIHLYNWDLELLGSFDASKFAEGHTHLRRIELTSDLSLFLFTVIDKAYLLDSKLNLIKAWSVPNKEGFEKRKSGGSSTENSQVKECLELLELDNNKPSQEEIKIAFRKSILKWHPDKNPDNPEAEERTILLIQAYEYLTGEDAQRAFDDISKESYYWVDLSKTTRIEANGFSFEINFTIGSGEDWIYGSGMSENGGRIYLGCYSGKIYQINQNGIAEKIYLVPEGQINNYPLCNPISFVTEYNDRKYILTKWYLYILKDDKLRGYIKNEKGRFKWFEKGFIQQRKNQIILFDPDGVNQGLISFKSAVLLVGYKHDILFVETNTKAYTFRLAT